MGQKHCMREVEIKSKNKDKISKMESETNNIAESMELSMFLK